MTYRKGMTDEELLAWLDSWSVEDEARALSVARRDEDQREGDDDPENDG